MSKLVAEYLQHPLSASANIALLDDGNVGGVLGATLGSKLNIAGGKILQIVRATDTTDRTTTSTSFVDVTGMSVTITPQKNDSAILIVASYLANRASNYLSTAITDASNNAISGSERRQFGANTANSEFATQTIIAYATPATTSPTTYKMRFRIEVSGTARIRGDLNTSQLFAIEVSA